MVTNFRMADIQWANSLFLVGNNLNMLMAKDKDGSNKVILSSCACIEYIDLEV